MFRSSSEVTEGRAWDWQADCSTAGVTDGCEEKAELELEAFNLPTDQEE